MKKQEDVTTRGRRARVHLHGPSAGGRQDPDGGIFGEKRAAVVAAAAVDCNDFRVGMQRRGRRQVRERLRQGTRLVEVGHDDGDLHRLISGAADGHRGSNRTA